jgi:hypothetical protein
MTVSEFFTVPEVHSFGNFGFHSLRISNKLTIPRYISPMDTLIFCVLVQLNLIFGVAGLLWPDKLKPFFGVLMFPWPASYRAIRTHGIVAIIGYVLVLGKLLVISQ